MSTNVSVRFGRVATVPRMRTTRNGNSVMSFRCAVDKRRKGENGWETVHTNWLGVSLWNELAMQFQALQKGMVVAFSGDLVIDEWVDHEGNVKPRADVTVKELEVVHTKGSGGGSVTVDPWATSEPVATTAEAWG